MTRYTKNAHGQYLIHGHKYEMLEGSRAQVMHGTAYKTSGGLKKSDLLQNKNGRIVSKKKHHTAKKEKRLIKSGYGTKKGHFGAVKLGSRRRSRKMRGGFSSGDNMSPGPVSGNSEGVGSAAYVSGPAPHLGGSAYAVHPAVAYGGKKSKHRKHRGGSASPSAALTNAANMAKGMASTLTKGVTSAMHGK